MRILIFTGTTRPNTSIGKFYSHLTKVLKAKGIDYELYSVRDIDCAKVGKRVFKILRVFDFINCTCFKKKIDTSRFDVFFNDMNAGSCFFLFKKRLPTFSISLYRNSGWNFIEGYTKTGGIGNLIKSLYVFISIVLLQELPSVRASDVILAVSYYTKKNLTRNGIRPDKIKVIRNAIETNKFYPRDKRECRKHLGLDENVFYLIFVGRFTPDKGREIVIRTMDLLKDYPIKLLLIDDRGYSGELPPNVIYVGKVPNGELPLWLNAADVFFFPSLYEGDSLACLEAASSGLPLVASNTGGLWELKKRKEKYLSELIVDIKPPDKAAVEYASVILMLFFNRKFLKKARWFWTKWGRK
ncbi:MAG TPA: glycosyltransferase, partial [Thermococcus litoralis]|nr:glycosyltransferase [Thermococcus litoralis]